MRKTLALVCCLLVSNAALAESEIDKALKSIGLVDENYVYVADEALVTDFFRYTTNQYAKSLPSDINSYSRIQSAMFTPHFADVQGMFTIPFTADERREVINALSSKELLQELCIDYFIPNEFMLANNYTLMYAFHDQNYRLLKSVQVNTFTCLEALNEN